MYMEKIVIKGDFIKGDECGEYSETRITKRSKEPNGSICEWTARHIF